MGRTLISDEPMNGVNGLVTTLKSVFCCLDARIPHQNVDEVVPTVPNGSSGGNNGVCKLTTGIWCCLLVNLLVTF